MIEIQILEIMRVGKASEIEIGLLVLRPHNADTDASRHCRLSHRLSLQALIQAS